jgi:hypothetical protein
MCRSVHVLLSESERKAASRMTWGVMVPIYASIGLVLLATLALNVGSREGKMVAEARAAAPGTAANQR